MVVSSNKKRIYDLAREWTPDDLDEKVHKKVQAELTRQIINISPKFNQHPKTASSSIDIAAVQDIQAQIDVKQIIEDCLAGKSKKKVSKPASESTASETKTEEPPKKKLKIVRRLGTAPKRDENGEIIPEEPKAESPEPSPPATEEPAAAVEESSTTVEEEPIVEEPEEAPKDHVQEMLNNMQSKKEKSKPKSSGQISTAKLDSVKSIPLKPSGQPYRVGRPTILPQGMGRKKKKLSPEERQNRAKPKVKEVQEEAIREIYVADAMTVRELSQKASMPETDIVTYFFNKGIIKTVNQVLEKDLVVEFCESKNFLVYTEGDIPKEETELQSTLKEDEAEGSLMQRPPVVTIMGHVDHGKTTLLDAIRESKTNVVDTESGGITQHIGAYQVSTQDYDGNERPITFLDTPGHEAFTAMRKRGANITDIVILVVAADDGLMPQTIEAIKHTKEAKVPFLVAVNKIDKPEANTDKVLGQLAEHEIVAEQYGGPVQCSFISAKEKRNLDELLEKIILVADAELDEKIKSNPNRHAVGTVVEAELSKSKGPITTLLVQNGTLKKGDCISAGAASGRVRAMFDDTGAEVDAAGPSTPVKLLGLTSVPLAGDTFQAHKNYQEAKKAADEIAHKLQEEKRFKGLSVYASEFKEGQQTEFHIIVKADVQGSAEAVAHELNKLSTEEVLVKPITVSSGSITANDVELAARTGASIVGFHVGPDATTAKLAQKQEVQIKTYEVIYELTEDVRRLVLGLHAPEKEEVKLGATEIRQLFNIGKKKVAGCYVTEGKVVRYEIARLFREGVMIYEGKIDYLKRYKDDAKEVKEKLECGLSFEKFNDIQEGDLIECWTIKEIARTKL